MKRRKILAIAAFLITGSAALLTPASKASAECCDRSGITNVGYCTLWNGLRVCVSPGYSCDSTC